MSKSLHARIETEIARREQLKKKEQEEKERKERKQCEEDIFAKLEQAFAKCLAELEAFKKLQMREDDIRYYDKGLETAKELGFIVEFDGNIREGHYNMFIPNFQSGKGEKRTPAQRKLFEFEQQLKKARRERKAQLLAECKRVKEMMEKGDYTYTYGIMDDDTEIRVKTSEEVEKRFERDVVDRFFFKFKLTFLGSGNVALRGVFEEVWRFRL